MCFKARQSLLKDFINTQYFMYVFFRSNTVEIIVKFFPDLTFELFKEHVLNSSGRT